MNCGARQRKDMICWDGENEGERASCHFETGRLESDLAEGIAIAKFYGQSETVGAGDLHAPLTHAA